MWGKGKGEGEGEGEGQTSWSSAPPVLVRMPKYVQ